MGRVPQLDDQVAVTRRHNRQIDDLRQRKRCHAESKTFLVPGDITAGLYVPPFFVAIDPDDNNPEWKTLYEFPGGVMRVGSCVVRWLLNSISVGSQNCTTTPNDDPFILDTPIELTNGDYLQPEFLSASGDAVDFAGPVFILTQAA
jgi:hypothetical protein